MAMTEIDKLLIEIIELVDFEPTDQYYDLTQVELIEAINDILCENGYRIVKHE